MTTSPGCEWTDAEHGFREEVAFVAGSMFTVTVTPLEPPRALGLICPPLADDLVRNYRREVVLARRLARRGIAIQRFHYRSTGNSLGDATDIGLSDLIDDARGALQLGSQPFDDLPVAFFGARFGALVAAALASEHAGAPAALWDPVPDVAEFVRDVVRIERVVALSDRGTATPAPAGGRSTALATRRLPGRLVAERDEHSLTSIVDGPLGDVLVASLVEGRDARSTNTATDALRAIASNVETVSFSLEGSWWPVGGLRRRAEDEPWPLIDHTVEWLAAALGVDQR